MDPPISRKARRAVLAAVAVTVAGLAAPGRAGADPTRETFWHASSGTGACGSWWKETLARILAHRAFNAEG